MREKQQARSPRISTAPSRTPPHFNASAAKSYIGLMVATLAHQGLLDRSAPASAHVPELAGTAFGDATIEDLLHMGTQVCYAGRPFDKAIEAQRYFAVIAPQLRPYGYNGPTTIREHLLTARATGRPGTGFRYENGNVETLAEVLRRVTGLTTSALLSEMIWSKIGAEEDAYYILDGDGVEAACGGFSATARDVARLGEMLRCGGAIGDRQVVPEGVATTITSGVPDGYPRRVRFPAAPPESPATLSYHDLWWIPNDPYGSYLASGIHGQRLLVSPGLDLVAVHFGAQVISPDVPVARSSRRSCGSGPTSHRLGELPVNQAAVTAALPGIRASPCGVRPGTPRKFPESLRR
ncbi:serine hydrolase domain-containing protein [Streptomyces sp. NPDC054835]|uniref:serine hydrolase domain-containing protein n=1 Tax=Streptomyces sp. NBC_01268 TaxID=2903806 RepID=UPI002E2F52B1|nr:serine hydrolase [Streptomyces sp. NBC_01268]